VVLRVAFFFVVFFFIAKADPPPLSHQRLANPLLRSPFGENSAGHAASPPECARTAGRHR
jgi:hypothetical protein